MLHERWDVANENIEEKLVEKVIDYIKSGNYEGGYYIMLNDGTIVKLNKYAEMASKVVNKSYAFVYITSTDVVQEFLYPLLSLYDTLVFSYISKLGLYHCHYYDGIGLRCFSAPATFLKYVVIYIEYGEYSAIEVVSLDNAINNTNLRMIDNAVLNNYIHDKNLDELGYIEIRAKLQRLFAGYSFSDVWGILYSYYSKNDKSKANEVDRIISDYNRIFRPSKVCIDKKTWNQVNCSMIKG